MIKNKRKKWVCVNRGKHCREDYCYFCYYKAPWIKKRKGSKNLDKVDVIRSNIKRVRKYQDSDLKNIQLNFYQRAHQAYCGKPYKG